MKRLPIACAAAALATLAIPSGAQALTWNWSFTSTSGSATGTFTTDGSAPPVIGQEYTITGITGNGSFPLSGNSPTGHPITGLGSLTPQKITYLASGLLASSTGISFIYTNLAGPWSISLVDATNDGIETVVLPSYFGSGPITSSSLTAPSAPASSVPGPLPLLGAGAAFGWSRRLRRRVISSADPSRLAAIVPPQGWS